MKEENAQPAGELNCNGFDPLDMRNYPIEKLLKRAQTEFERWLAIAGVPLAIVAFVLFGFILKVPFLQDIDALDLVSKTAQKEFERIGAEAFSRHNAFMLAIFLAALILWITEALPNYLTSLILIISLVLTGVLPGKEAYAQLGHPAMWLNIMSFVLARMLVATGVAKQFASKKNYHG